MNVRYRVVEIDSFNYNLQYKRLFWWFTLTVMVGLDTWAPMHFGSEEKVDEYVVVNCKRNPNRTNIIKHPKLKLMNR